MKLTTTILAVLPFACTAHPGQRKQHKKSERHARDYNLPYQAAKHYLQPDRPIIHHEKRQNISPIEQGDKFQFLPPHYDPSSTHLKSPYPLSGVSTYDDSGRAQMFDNMLPDIGLWGSCPPTNLDCDNCPRDARCVVHTSDDGSYPYSSSYDGPPGTKGACPLHTCKPTHDLGSAWACGRNAKCARGHCVCKSGFKGADKEGQSVRGFDDLNKVTVWVDVSMDCDVPCDSFSCKEVEQVDACFQRYENGVVVPAGVDMLETGQTGGGAIQVPGAAE